MIELIAICQNNIYMAGVVLGVAIVAVLLAMYIVQIIKDVKALPTPSPAATTLIAITLAGGLTELGVYLIVGFYSGIGILGAGLDLVIYTLYGNVEPEKKALKWAVDQTAGRITAINRIDTSSPVIPDYKGEVGNGK